MSNGFLELQRAAKAGHFRKAIFYKKLPSLSIENPDGFEAGAPFSYGKITDEKTLTYLGGHISIQQNDVVIETYADFEWKEKSKIKLETGRILQVKTSTPTEEVVSPVSRVIKWTITLG